MARREPTPNARGAQTRKRVLEAALEVVRERPLAEVQLQQIADRAGISPGHVLYHFGSKEDILIATLARSEAEIAEERARDLAGLDDPVDRLERWIVLFLPRGADDPTWKLWLELWLRAGREEREAAPRVAASWVDDFHRIVTDGLESGAFRLDDEDVEHFWNWAHGLLIGLSIGVLIHRQSLDEAIATALRSVAKELHCTFAGSAAGPAPGRSPG